MPDTLVVGGLERLADPVDDAGRPRQIHPALCQCAAQGHAFHVLHHQELFAVGGFARVENPHDTRMVDSRQRLHLLLELLADPGILTQFRQQYLDHHRP